MDLVEQKEMKKKVRTLLVTYICALTKDDITSIVESETRREHALEDVVAGVQPHFPAQDKKAIRRFLDSVVGNMTQCLKDLGDSAPEDAGQAKLEHWTNVWRTERSKSKRARNIDVQDVHSHKARTLFYTAGASQDTTEVGADREHLVRTRYMSQCAMGVYLIPEAIKRGRMLGKGSYGVVSECHIEGVTWLPPEVTYVVKDFKGNEAEKRHSFALESSVQLFHRGIVRCIAQTHEEPWSLIFPRFNGMDLGDMLECVPPPKGRFANILLAQKEDPRRPPTVAEIDMCKHMLEWAPHFMNALVRTMAHAHSKGIIHCDLHPWNIMTDFTKEGIPRVGVIDWGLALRVGIEQRMTNITDLQEHKLRPWRAPELFNVKSPCPYTKATDTYAVAFCIASLCEWCKDFSDHYNIPYKNRMQVDVGMIGTIMYKNYLKPPYKQRKTMQNMSEHFDMLELNPEACLRPLSEMIPKY